MSSARYSPTDGGYWSSPRLKKPVNVNVLNPDINHNVGDSMKTAHGIKSLSEPSSPQLWHKGGMLQTTAQIIVLVGSVNYNL